MTGRSQMRCEHGRTVSEECKACADPVYDQPCRTCGAEAGYGCVGESGDLTAVHPIRWLDRPKTDAASDGAS